MDDGTIKTPKGNSIGRCPSVLAGFSLALMIVVSGCIDARLEARILNQKSVPVELSVFVELETEDTKLPILQGDYVVDPNLTRALGRLQMPRESDGIILVRAKEDGSAEVTNRGSWNGKQEVAFTIFVTNERNFISFSYAGFGG